MYNTKSMPLIKLKATETPAPTAVEAAAAAAAAEAEAIPVTATKKTNRIEPKSMPATPIVAKEIALFGLSSSSEAEFEPHSYPNHTLNITDDEQESERGEFDEDSSLAMITPPPPYNTQQQQQQQREEETEPVNSQKRRFLFHNRETFNISSSLSSSQLGATRTRQLPTNAKLSAVFTAPKMAQLNRKLTNLHRKRRRRSSSSGDSKELDKLVLQSVDWDDNDNY